MIRIRFFGPRESIQNEFGDESFHIFVVVFPFFVFFLLLHLFCFFFFFLKKKTETWFLFEDFCEYSQFQHLTECSRQTHPTTSKTHGFKTTPATKGWRFARESANQDVAIVGAKIAEWLELI